MKIKYNFGLLKQLDIGFSSQNTKDEPSKIIINVVERTFFKMLSFLSFIQSTPFLAL